jgi:hypothetical protein
MKFGLPLWFIDILVNWYSKLYVAVRWNGILSDSFIVPNGVRQGILLSPAIFNVFINVFINSLRALKLDCCVNNDFIGCVLYADDIFFIICQCCRSAIDVRLLFFC